LVFTIPSTTFLGNNFTWNAYSLIPVVLQSPQPIIQPYYGQLTPSGTSIFISGNGILQPFQFIPDTTAFNGYCFSVINSIGVSTIAFQSVFLGTTDIQYTLQITLPIGSAALSQFTNFPSPLKFEIQPVSIATFPS